MSVARKIIPAASGGAAGSGAASDFKDVTLLIHGDGSNAGQNNTFLDSSDSNHTVTASGGVYQGTFSPFSEPEGNWSIYCDGTTDTGLHIGDHADFNIASQNFCMEAWIHVDADTGNTRYIAGHSNAAGQNASGAVQFQIGSNNKLTAYIFNAADTNNYLTLEPSSTTIADNRWYHVAVVRNGTAWNLYQDGVSIANVTSSIAVNNSTSKFGIGLLGEYTAGHFKGYISNFRLVVGSPVYTGNFTPSTTPLTAITNTKILSCGSNRFVDRSGSAHLVLPRGHNGYNAGISTHTKPFSPFSQRVAYNPSTHGGSCWFNQGTNTYLSITDGDDFDFGTADYCIEFWARPTNAMNTSWAMPFGTSGVNQYWGWTSGGGTEANAGFSTYPAGGYSGDFDHNPCWNAWNHCVYQVTSGYENWYLNGKQIYNVQNNPSYSSGATGMYIGKTANYASNYMYAGYLSDVRIIKGNGYNPYSNASTITVPTAPLTKTSYTKLLLNFTNASIIDHSSSSNIYITNNAQLDTTVKKFGTASVEFDSSGDYLYISSRDAIHIGTGDCTIEGWAYFANNTSDDGIFSRGVPVNQVIAPALAKRDSTGLTIYTGGASGQKITGGTGIVQANTWYHFAYVRESGVVKVYWNGTIVTWNDGTTSVSDTSDYGKNDFTIGMYYGSNYEMQDGYIDEFRITKKAMYTSNFTPRTTAFDNA